MKTSAKFLAALSLGFLTLLPANANPKKDKKNAEHNQATHTLYSMFKSVPTNESLMGKNDEDKITVSFRVDDEREITNVKIQGSNDRLIEYAYNTFSKHASAVDLGLNKGVYQVTLRFQLIK